jgi:hypothetical protein
LCVVSHPGLWPISAWSATRSLSPHCGRPLARRRSGDTRWPAASLAGEEPPRGRSRGTPQPASRGFDDTTRPSGAWHRAQVDASRGTHRSRAQSSPASTRSKGRKPWEAFIPLNELRGEVVHDRARGKTDDPALAVLTAFSAVTRRGTPRRSRRARRSRHRLRRLRRGSIA